jgi:hypothetical protein
MEAGTMQQGKESSRCAARTDALRANLSSYQ